MKITLEGYIHNQYGEECSEYEAGCPCCEAYRFLRDNGYPPDPHKGENPDELYIVEVVVN